jgi:Rho-binding antiterminator
MGTDYRPIDCGFHDVLEACAIRRVRCRNVIGDVGDGARTVESRIVDIHVADGEEFIEVEDGERIRLDRLVEVTAITA